MRDIDDGKNKKKVWSMFYLDFDIIAGLLSSIFKTSFSIKLLKNILIEVAIKDNEIKNGYDKVDKINKILKNSKNCQKPKNP